MRSERAIQLRRKYKIKLPDAIIAATSLVYDLSLISADVVFSKIEQNRAWHDGLIYISALPLAVMPSFVYDVLNYI